MLLEPVYGALPKGTFCRLCSQYLRISAHIPRMARLVDKASNTAFSQILAYALRRLARGLVTDDGALSALQSNGSEYVIYPPAYDIVYVR